MKYEDVKDGVTRSIGIEIVVRLVYRTNARRTGKKEKTCGIYNPEKEFSVAIIATEIALQDLIQEAKEDYARQDRRQATREQKKKRKPTKKEAMLFAEEAQGEQAREDS